MILRIQAFPRDGFNELFDAWSDPAGTAPKIITSATFRCVARHQITNAQRSLTGSVAFPADPSNANVIRVSGSLLDWVAGVWDAELSVNEGSGWNTAHRFEILVHEAIG